MSTTPSRNRIEERRGFTDKTRLRLLEGDQDQQEAVARRLEGKLDKIQGRLTALLLTIAGSSVMLMVTTLVAVGKVG